MKLRTPEYNTAARSIIFPCLTFSGVALARSASRACLKTAPLPLLAANNSGVWPSSSWAQNSASTCTHAPSSKTVHEINGADVTRVISYASRASIPSAVVEVQLNREVLESWEPAVETLCSGQVMKSLLYVLSKVGFVMHRVANAADGQRPARLVYFTCYAISENETGPTPERDKKKTEAGACLLMGQLVPQEVQHDAKNLGFPSLRGVHE